MCVCVGWVKDSCGKRMLSCTVNGISEVKMCVHERHVHLYKFSFFCAFIRVASIVGVLLD